MSIRRNYKTISANYSMTYSDGLIDVSGAGFVVDMPLYDGTTPSIDDGRDLKNGKYFYFNAPSGVDLQTIDAITKFAINGSTTYSVAAGTNFKITYYNAFWYITFLDVASAGTGTVTNVATAGLISGGPITTTGTITTSMNTARLVGRSTAGVGIMEEIVLGTNLSFTGLTLNAASTTTTPGGLDTQFQFNNAGVFAGDAALVFTGGAVNAMDSRFIITDNGDPTKRMSFELSGITTGTLRTITAANWSGIDVLSNGALTTPRIPYSGATGLQDSANLVWDNANSQLTLLGAGTAALPTIGIGAVDTGIYLQAGNTLGFSTAGTLKFILDATSFRANNTGGGIVKFAAGTAGSPAFSFTGDTNTGIWNSSADTLAFSASGATQFFISDAPAFFGTVSNSPYIKASAGTAALPTYSFVSDTDTGMWSNAANTIKFSVLGGQTETINTTGHYFGSSAAPTARVHIAAGSASASAAPIKLTSGTVMTTPEAGAVEFTTDDLFFTITTGAARKNITIWDTLGTTGRVPFGTTNGRLTDSSNLGYTSGTGLLVSDNIKLQSAGNGLYIKEGANATMGIATLVAGTVVVNTTKVTANSRIFLTRQTVSGTLGASVDVTARTAATSFTITANGSVLDTSDVAWLIMEPV